MPFAKQRGAQIVPVRTGDHPDFTRVVLEIGPDREWDLSQVSADEWELILTPSLDGFDLSRAFRIIQRERLLDLSDNGNLVLSLNCRCPIDAFRYLDDFLVLDIMDPDGRDTPFDTAPRLAIEPRVAAEALPDLTRLLNRPMVFPLDTPAEPSRPSMTDPDQQSNERVAEAAAIMAEQLARAAAAGLLDAALDQPFEFGDPVVETEEVSGASDGTGVAGPPPTNPPIEIAEPTVSLPIRTETPFDAIVVPSEILGPSRPEGGCQGTPLNARDWASSETFQEGLGEIRNALYDERDALVPSSARALGEHYLHFGFGQEARYWLDQSETAPPELFWIADFIDGSDATPFPDTIDPENCSLGELFWRYSMGAISVPLPIEELGRLERAFGALPPNLRDLVGPRVARRLHQDGYAGTARNIRDALSRGGRLSETDLRLLDLDIGVPPDRSATTTRAALTEAMRDDGANPVRVAAAALAFDRDAGILPSVERVVAAEALLREAGDSPDTSRLWLEVILAHAAMGNVDTALRMLSEPDRDSASRNTAITHLIRERLSVGDVASVLLVAHRFGPDWVPEGSEASRVQVEAIATLRTAGLFEGANALQTNRRPLALPTRPPEEVDGGDAARDAWVLSDWQRLAEADRGAHSEIAARLFEIAESGENTPLEETDLSRLAETVLDSQALRGSIDALLSNPSLQQTN